VPQLRHHRQGHRKVGRKRFPNKSVKVKERAYEQARQLESELVETPVPSVGIVLDLGVDKVSGLIRSVISDEDAFQDAWEAVLQDHVGSEEDIIRIAKEIRRKHTSETIVKEHTEVSLDEPVGEHRDEHDFTLKDILAAEPVVIDSPTRVYRREKPRSVSLDTDTQATLMEQFPNLSYRDAVRHLAGLPPAAKQNPLWQPWEDGIIRERYAWGGSLAVSVDLENRSLDSIRLRARHLGIKFDRFRPNGEWLTRKETASVLGFSIGRLRALARDGLLSSVPVKHETNSPSYFFPVDGIERFLKTHFWLYDATAVSPQYQHCIPAERQEWVRLHPAAELAKCGYQTVLRYIRLGLVPTQTCYPRQGQHTLVRVEDVKKVIEHFKGRCHYKQRSRPYKTVMRHGMNHCVIQDEEGDWHWRCKGTHSKSFCLNPRERRWLNRHYVGLHLRPPQFTRGKPTCKVCLAIWNAEIGRLEPELATKL